MFTVDGVTKRIEVDVEGEAALLPVRNLLGRRHAGARPDKRRSRRSLPSANALFMGCRFQLYRQFRLYRVINDNRGRSRTEPLHKFEPLCSGMVTGEYATSSQCRALQPGPVWYVDQVHCFGECFTPIVCTCRAYVCIWLVSR